MSLINLDSQYVMSLDNLDMALLSKYIENASKGTRPIWTKPDLDGESTFQEVKLVMPDAESSDTYICHICNVHVPLIYVKQHEESQKHQTYMKLSEIINENYSKHKKIYCYDSYEKDFDTFYCDVCAEAFPVECKNDHDLSDKHLECKQKDQLALDFLNMYIENGNNNICQKEENDTSSVKNTSEKEDHKQNDLSSDGNISQKEDHKQNDLSSDGNISQKEDHKQNDLSSDGNISQKEDHEKDDPSSDKNISQREDHEKDDLSSDKNISQKEEDEPDSPSSDENISQKEEDEPDILSSDENISQKDEDEPDILSSDENISQKEEIEPDSLSLDTNTSQQSNVEENAIAAAISSQELIECDSQNSDEDSEVEEYIEFASDDDTFVDNPEQFQTIKAIAKNEYVFPFTNVSDEAKTEDKPSHNIKKNKEFEDYINTVFPKRSKRKMNKNYDILVLGDYIVILIGNGRHKITIDQYHSYRTFNGSIYCQICQIWICDKKVHWFTDRHVKLVTEPLDFNFIRKINAEWSHCLVCNERIDTDSDHASSNTYHIRQLYQSDDGTETAYCYICLESVPIRYVVEHSLSEPHASMPDPASELNNNDAKYASGMPNSTFESKPKLDCSVFKSHDKVKQSTSNNTRQIKKPPF